MAGARGGYNTNQVTCAADLHLSCIHNFEQAFYHKVQDAQSSICQVAMSNVHVDKSGSLCAVQMFMFNVKQMASK